MASAPTNQDPGSTCCGHAQLKYGNEPRAGIHNKVCHCNARRQVVVEKILLFSLRNYLSTTIRDPLEGIEPLNQTWPRPVNLTNDEKAL